MSMMDTLPRMENLIPTNEEEDCRYIEQCVLTAQKAILKGGLDINPALDVYSNRLVELEKRMKIKLNADQFDLFIEMRKGRDAFSWKDAEEKQ
ncbi:MAG: hypothetical protein WAU28_04680 [Candidatus Moraniibacteriota bacterium]